MFENLKKLRLEQKLNQTDFGQLFGVPKSTYQGYEAGDREPDSSFWVSVADRYKVSTDFLLGMTDDKRGTKYGARSALDEKYAALDDHGRRLVDAIIEIEASRSKTQPIIEVAPKTKIIPLFPAAAMLCNQLCNSIPVHSLLPLFWQKEKPEKPIFTRLFRLFLSSRYSPGITIAVNTLSRFFNASRLQLCNRSVIALVCHPLNYSLLPPVWQ